MKSELHIQAITDAYNIYTSGTKSISTPAMAASLQACIFLFKICQDNQFKKLIDLGSGITSFVLRYYQSLYNDVTVYSVDDNADWLEKTKSFIQHFDLNNDNFVHMINAVKELNFDLVVYDYGYMDVRKTNLRKAIGLCATTGTIYCDDCHKVDYYKYVKRVINDNYIITEVPSTFDTYERFGILLTKK